MEKKIVYVYSDHIIHLLILYKNKVSDFMIGEREEISTCEEHLDLIIYFLDFQLGRN